MTAVAPAPIEALPTPEEVQATFDRMRSAVMERYTAQDEDIADAQAIIENAEAEQARLRDQYPMFFPERASAPRGKGQPSLEQKNQALRIIAEHPGLTRKQLARHMSYSPSWVSAITAMLRHEDYLVLNRKGRQITYALSELGQTTVGNGGLRA